MQLAIILIAGAVVIFVWLLLWTLQRERLGDLNETFRPLPIAPSDDAVITATEFGRILHVNDTLRRWLDMDAPDLESIAARATPSDSFRGLFAAEGKTSFRLDRRWVEGRSLITPLPDGTHQVLITLRELTSATTSGREDVLDAARAVEIVNRIGQSVAIDRGVEPVLQAVLSILRVEVGAEEGELTLWDATSQRLQQRAWVGDSAYLLALAEVGGVYAPGEGIAGEMARTRQPLLSVDPDDAGRAQPHVAVDLYQSFVGVPLFDGDQLLGTLMLAHREPHRFTDGDLALLTAVAPQAAATILNAIRYDSQTRRIADLSGISALTSSAGDSETLFAALSQRVADLLEAEIAGLLTVSDARDRLVAQPPFHNLPAQIVRSLTIDLTPDSLIGRDWAERDHWSFLDLRADVTSDAPGLRMLADAAGVRSLLLLPLAIGDRRVGALMVANKRSVIGFSERDVATLRLFAAQAAYAIETKRLVERERLQEDERVGLQAIAQVFSVAEADRAALNALLARFMRSQIGGVLLFSADDYALVPQLPFAGIAADALTSYRITLEPGTPIAGLWAMQDTWYANDLATNSIVYGAGLGELAAALGVHNTLIAAIRIGGRKIGAVQVANRDGGYNDDDARLLLVYAAQVGALVENQRLFEEVQMRATESDGLRLAAEYASQILRQDDDFLPLLREVCRLTGSDSAFVSLLDPETGSLVIDPRYVYGMELGEPLIFDSYTRGFERAAAISRRTFLNNNLPGDSSEIIPHYVRLAETLNIHRQIIVPLIAGDVVVGELAAINRANNYESDDLRLLGSLAVHVAAAFDRIRMQALTGQNLRRRLLELDAIARVSNELAQTLDFESVLEIIRLEAVRAAEATFNTVVIVTADGDRPKSRLGESKGIERSLLALERAALLTPDNPVIVDDFADEMAHAPYPPTARSAVASAFTHEGKAVGVLYLAHDQPMHFDQQAITFITALAAKASLAYGNHRRYLDTVEQTSLLRRRIEQLQQVFELGNLIQADTDIPSLLEALAFSIQQSVGFDIIILLMREEGVLRRSAQAGVPVDAFERSRDRTITLTAMETLLAKQEFHIGEALFLPISKVSQWHVPGVEAMSANSTTRTLHPRGRDDWQDGDMLIAPMRATDGELIGVIALDRPFDGKRPDTSVTDVLSIFAHQGASVIENVRKLGESRVRTERLSLLNRVGVALQQSLDNENIFEVALRETAKLLNAPRARAHLIERDAGVASVVVEHPRGEEPPDELVALPERASLVRLLRDNAPVLVEDRARIDDFDPLGADLDRLGAVAYALIPMTMGGHPNGALELIYDTPQRFDPEKLELGRLIANQAAVSILNSNLLEQTLMRTRELETLLEAAQATSMTLELSAVYQNILRLTAQALEIDEVMVLTYDNIDDTLMVEQHIDNIDEDRIVPPGTIYVVRDYPTRARVLSERQIVVVRVDDESADEVERAEMHAEGDVERMFVPLIIRDQPLGMLIITLCARLRTFSARERRIAQGLGAQAATAIENARLTTETAKQVEKSLALNEISRAVSSTMDIDRMVRVVREQVPALTDADLFYLALYNHESGRIVFPVAVERGRSIEMLPRDLSDDEVSFVIKRKTTLTLGGENPSIAQVRHNLGIRDGEPGALRYLAVPIIAGDRVVGVIAIRDAQSSRPYGLNDQRILTTVATQLGVTIQNAELYNRTQQFAQELNTRVEARTSELAEERDRLESLYRITSELGRSLDADRLLSRSLTLLGGSIGADEAVVLLVDAITDRFYPRVFLDGRFVNDQAILRGAMRLVDDDSLAHHPAELIADWLKATARSGRIADLQRVDFWDAEAESASTYRSALGVMLESNDELIGALVFFGKRVDQFSEPQERLITTAASQIAVALSNADLYSLIREQNDRMAAVLQTEQEERQKNSAILEGINDGVLLADRSGVIILYNRAAEVILGIPREFALGEALASLNTVSPDTARWLPQLLRWLNEEERQLGDDLRIERLEIGRRVVTIYAAPVSSGQRILGTVTVFRDVTRDAEVDRMKSEFISNVSHELRTPMTSIKGYADLLIKGMAGDVSETQERFLRMIKQNTSRLELLVNDLLSISELDSGRDSLEIGEVAMVDVIAEVIDSLKARSAYSLKPLVITTNVADDLPLIRGDYVKLTRLVGNLVDNAFHYTPADGGIHITADRREGQPSQVMITVADTGIGIPDEFRDRVWDRFARYDAHALVMEVSGTGLGLSIVKAIAEMHGGSVWFDSTIGVGTTFYVTLPIDGSLSTDAHDMAGTIQG